MKYVSAQQVQLLAGPTASATTAISASLDTSTYGADFITILAPVNAEANTNSTNVVLSVLHSDDTVVTNHVTLAATAVIDNTSANVGVRHINWVGKKRYLRVTVTPDTTTNGAVIPGGIVAIINPEVRGQTDAATGTVVRIE